MKRVLTALVLAPLVLAVVFLGPRWQWLFTVAVAAVATLAAWEFLGLAEEGGAKPPRVAVLVAHICDHLGCWGAPYLASFARCGAFGFRLSESSSPTSLFDVDQGPAQRTVRTSGAGLPPAAPLKRLPHSCAFFAQGWDSNPIPLGI